jgi:hypothetical protein
MVFAGAAPALPPTARRAIRGRQPQYCRPLAKKSKVLASKTPRCHRPPFSPSFGTVQGAWSARFPSTASVIRTRCSCHRDYARISTEARYWAPFVKRSEPMRSDGCQLNSSRFDASAGMHAPQSWPSSIRSMAAARACSLPVSRAPVLSVPRADGTPADSGTVCSPDAPRPGSRRAEPT